MLTSTWARRIVLLASLTAATMGVAACEHTIRGVGADARETSDAVTDATN